mmetsp:Transcript_53551/g.113732  ORF Transcript_53551/g.113732 Transcript_53551/m.113732 type:complete len:206 (-) Transcript_53551:410-1027(-)
MPGHPRAEPAAVPGLSRRQDDLRRAGDRSRLGDVRHVGAVQGRRKNQHGDGGRKRRQNLRIRPAGAHPVVPLRPRGREARLPRHLPSVSRVVRAVDGRRRGLRILPGGGLPEGGGGIDDALPVDEVRPALPPPQLPLRGDGEPVPHVRHSHAAGGGSEPGGRGGSRGGAQLVGEFGDERDVGALLAERGVDDVLATEDHGQSARE